MDRSEPQLRDLFERALALAAGDRAAFLESHCQSEALRLQVLALIDADADAGEPPSGNDIERLADHIGTEEPAMELPPGSLIGPFVIGDVLGEGGSSTVFHATREIEGATQHVALKLLRRSLHSPEAQRLFRREQRALIQLRHPHIARMIEGGVTATGVPYIALELVDGTPITTHAREHRLDLHARLRLFTTVCRAVDAAHRALIVHRDLKPSNVLVSADGEVKLLDFGVAKLLADDDDSRTMLPAFTPAYAAPEQRNSGAITTATDVYALGILLGELLTGERVNDGHGRTPSAQVSETAADGVLPAAPAVTRRRLRGDLDAIVVKATDEDAARRYASAGAFAEDLERLLDGRPVDARAPSGWYRTRKFVGRHKGAVASTLTFVVAILAALGLAIWQARLAHAEAQRANMQTRNAEAIRDFLVSVFESAQADLPRDKRPAVEDLVDDASARALRDDSMDEAMRAGLLLTLAKVAFHTGAFAQSHALLDRALPVLDRLYPATDAARLQARVLRANVLLAQARPAEAGALLEPMRAALSMRDDAAGTEALTVLGNALYGMNRHDDAQGVYAQARATAARRPARAEALALRIDVAQTESLVYAQRFGEALALADSAWRKWNATQREPDREVLTLLGSLSIAAEAGGDPERSEQAYRDAIEVAERLYARPHPDTAWVVGVYGSFLVAKARYDEAEPYLERALAMRRGLLGEAHPDTLNAVAAMGRLRAGQIRRDEAREWFEQGVATCRREQVRHNVCPRLLGSLSQLLSIAGRTAEAGSAAREAVESQRELTGADSPQLIGVLGFLARFQVQQGQHMQALATTDELLRIAERAGSSQSKDARYARFQRALALFALGRNDEALDLVAAVVAQQKEQTPDEKTSLFSMLMLQARTLSRAGRFDEAKATAAEALAIERKPQPLDAAVLAGLKRLADDGRGYDQ